MKALTIIVIAMVLPLVALCGCNSAPGRLAIESEVLRPNQIVNFDALYHQNCAGCHGEQGSGGAAIALNSTVYLEIIDDATLRRVTAQGVPGTAMPAFAQSSGGMLTDEQVNAIIAGMRSRWSKHASLNAALPAYRAAPGDPQHGADVYATYCFSCHGAAGRGGSHAGSVVDEAFLNLVSDQYLRTIVIVGRPELGAPDWRDNVPGRPMAQQDIADVVAWLSSQRSKAAISSSTTSLPGGIQ